MSRKRKYNKFIENFLVFEIIKISQQIIAMRKEKIRSFFFKIFA